MSFFLNCKISRIYIFLAMLIVPVISSAETPDSFGQMVPPDFEEKVQLARSYRLTYSGNYNPQEAIKILNGLIARLPEYYRGYYNLALTYAELNDYQNALENFEKALSIRERNNILDVTIFNSAGWVSMNAGDFQKAEQFFQKAIELKENNSFNSNRSVYNNMGQMFFNLQRFDEAKKYLSIARDEYKSTAAAETLMLIKDIEKLQSVEGAHR